MDPDGFNPRSHEGGIDGSTTPETSLTKFPEAASRQAATSFSQTQPESRTQINFKNLTKAIITKKKFRILFFHKIQKMMKKNPQNTKTSNQKKLKKNLQKFGHEKKINKILQKPKS